MDPNSRWSPWDLLNPVKAIALGTFFEYGVMLHELHSEHLFDGKRSKAQTLKVLREMGPKLRKQLVKDYVLFPLLAGPGAPFTFAGNVLANLGRNVWTFSIIFCGHFPDGAEQFDAVEVVGESKDDWYVRQALGSANIEGGDLFHLMTGHLSFQIEHHLFPDVPARRYREMAPRREAGVPRGGDPVHDRPAAPAAGEHGEEDLRARRAARHRPLPQGSVGPLVPGLQPRLPRPPHRPGHEVARVGAVGQPEQQGRQQAVDQLDRPVLEGVAVQAEVDVVHLDLAPP